MQLTDGHYPFAAAFGEKRTLYIETKQQQMTHSDSCQDCSWEYAFCILEPVFYKVPQVMKMLPTFWICKYFLQLWKIGNPKAVSLPHLHFPGHTQMFFLCDQFSMVVHSAPGRGTHSSEISLYSLGLPDQKLKACCLYSGWQTRQRGLTFSRRDFCKQSDIHFAVL